MATFAPLRGLDVSGVDAGHYMVRMVHATAKGEARHFMNSRFSALRIVHDPKTAITELGLDIELFSLHNSDQ